MLNNHMQSIVDYFSQTTDSKTTDRESRSQSALQAQTHRPSHLEPTIAYFAQSKSAQSQLSQNQLSQNQPAQQVALTQSKPARPTSPLSDKLRQLWQTMITINSEPQIREAVTASGETCWHVYDPISQASHTFFDEEDVYRWLEGRYYS